MLYKLQRFLLRFILSLVTRERGLLFSKRRFQFSNKENKYLNILVKRLFYLKFMENVVYSTKIKVRKNKKRRRQKIRYHYGFKKLGKI